MIVRNAHRSRPREGMTLLEVLIAMAVFLFALVAITELMNIAGRTASETRYRNVCARLAQSKMAEYVSGVSAMSSGGSGTFEEEGEPDWNWTVETSSQSAANLWSVTVKVTRDFEGDRPIETSLTQYIFDPAARGNPADSASAAPATTASSSSTSGSSTAGATGASSGTTPSSSSAPKASASPAPAPSSSSGSSKTGGKS